MEKIYYVEVVGNEVKPFINLIPEKIISKKVDTIEIKRIFLEEGMGEVSLIKQDLKDCCYDFVELKRLFLGDDIDSDEDIEDDDLFK